MRRLAPAVLATLRLPAEHRRSALAPFRAKRLGRKGLPAADRASGGSYGRARSVLVWTSRNQRDARTFGGSSLGTYRSAARRLTSVGRSFSPAPPSRLRGRP